MTNISKRMEKYHYHQDGCEFSFAPLDVCDCVERNMLAALDAAEAKERAAVAAAYEKVTQTLSDHAEGQEALLTAAREAGDDEDATYHIAAHNALMMALVSISELSDTDALAEYAEKVRAEAKDAAYNRGFKECVEAGFAAAIRENK